MEGRKGVYKERDFDTRLNLDENAGGGGDSLWGWYIWASLSLM